MHPFVANDLARMKMADLLAEADRSRLAKVARAGQAARKARYQNATDPSVEPRWSLRRLFAKMRLGLAASGA
ncbi:MAG TPA: hypothetical protein VGQ64_10025 [Candidatus Limnocylindrales bacterium]|jgi:hypothetical protein|nr:hypothetical protein [Candidatus Limnocylindrales bacterium]